MKKKLAGISAAALTFLAVAETANAFNIEVWIDPATWEVLGWQGDVGQTVLNFYDKLASHQDQFGNWHYRYFTAGFFDNAVIEDFYTLQVITNLDFCNNIFYIDRSAKTAYE